MEQFNDKQDFYEYRGYDEQLQMGGYPYMGSPYPYYRMADAYRQSRANGNWGMGAMDIDWNVSFNSIKVEVRLAGTIIAQGILTPSNAVLSIAGSAGGFSVRAALRADFTAMKLVLSGKLCGPVIGCVEFNSRQVTAW